MRTLYLVPAFIITILFGCDIIIEEPLIEVKQLTGFYEVDEWSETMEAQAFYEVNIFRDQFSRDGIYIDNFYNAGLRVFAELNGYKIRIPLQQIGYYEIEGIGTFYDGELTMDYTVSVIDGYFMKDVCNAICLKY